MVYLGVSFHMASHIEWFSKYENYDGGKVYLASDSTLQIVGCGRVKIQFPDGRIKGIDGIMHIPGLTQNLLYVSKLNDIGVQVSFLSNGCKMARWFWQGVLKLVCCTSWMHMLFNVTSLWKVKKGYLCREGYYNPYRGKYFGHETYSREDNALASKVRPH
jgi:hypothetical protein